MRRWRASSLTQMFSLREGTTVLLVDEIFLAKPTLRWVLLCISVIVIFSDIMNTKEIHLYFFYKSRLRAVS